MGQPTPRSAVHLLQPSTHFAQTQSVETNPREDQTRNTSLILYNLEPRYAATLIATDVAISKRCCRQRADRSGSRSMPPPTPRALQQFGALVFRDHALNLQQKVILRTLPNRAIEKCDLRSRATKLIDQQYLVCVAACQPVRCVHVKAIDAAARNRIPQLLKRRPLQVR